MECYRLCGFVRLEPRSNLSWGLRMCQKASPLLRSRFARLKCNNCGSRPAGEMLSCRDKKASKETLPGRSPRERRAVPCAPRSTRGLADSASLRCGQRAVPTAPRKTGGPDPRRPPVLGELLRGKINCGPEVSSHKSRLTLKSTLDDSLHERFNYSATVL